MTGIAANCIYELLVQLKLAMCTHALLIQGLRGRVQPFHPFIHESKPHPGQQWAAACLRMLLAGSQLVHDDLDGQNHNNHEGLIQDRYSIRCLPQYMGPIVDGIAQLIQQVTTEINSTNDNPLIDPDNQMVYHGGNFLGQYIGVGMDHLRSYVGLLAKHLDVQIALLVAPEFSNGLPPSFVGNTARKVIMGLKGLQLALNSITPTLAFLGNTLVDRYPTYAEQFNQNINSQGFASANLARQSIALFQQHMAIALMFGVQAVDLRSHAMYGHYDARRHLSPLSLRIYETVREIVGLRPSGNRAYIWNDHDQALDEHIVKIVSDIRNDGRLVQAINELSLS
jgi:phenylalanine ammonia-lyase